MRPRPTAVLTSLPRSYWLLWAGTLINRLGGFVVPFLTLYLTQRRGLPVGQAALMVSLFGAGSFASALLGGELADRLGRRPVMLLSFLLAPLNMIALGLVQPLVLLAPLTFTQGLLTDLYRPAVSAAIADLVPSDDRPRAFGYLYWAINLGFAIAPLLAGMMARFDYFLLFVGDAATTFAFGLIVLAGVRETRPAEAHAASRSPLPRRLRQLGASPLMLLFCLLTLATGMVYMQAFVALPVDMAAHGLGPGAYGLALAVNGALIVLLGLPAGNAAVRWPRFGAMAVAAALTGAGFGLTGLAASLPLFVLSIAVWTLGEIASSTIAPAIVADLSPVELRGLYQGAFGAAWGLSAFAGPLVGGAVYQRFGAGALWTACLVIGLLLAAGYLALGRRARHLP